MNKAEFLAALRARLARLPQKEVEERLAFYSEMIDDRVEEGKTEAQAISAIGSVETVAAQILEDIPLMTIFKDKINSHSLRSWEIALIVIGSPLWLPLLLTFGALVLVAYVVIWCVPLVLWAVELPFLIFEYLSKYCFIGCKYTTKGMWWLSKKIAYGIKRMFVGKGK